jgi:hypothetical protein
VSGRAGFGEVPSPSSLTHFSVSALLGPGSKQFPALWPSQLFSSPYSVRVQVLVHVYVQVHSNWHTAKREFLAGLEVGGRIKLGKNSNKISLKEVYRIM